MQTKCRECRKKLSRFALLAGVEPALLDALAEREQGHCHKYASGEEISSGKDFARGLGLVVRGAVEVYAPGSNRRVLLNVIGEGGMYGASTLYNPREGFVTQLVARGATTVFFLGEADVLALFRESPRALENYLGFVARRICFLNRKLEAVTAPGAEGKLMAYLLQNGQSGRVEVASFTQLALLLGIGRASLYRAVERLEQEGVLRREGKTLLLL